RGLFKTVLAGALVSVAGIAYGQAGNTNTSFNVQIQIEVSCSLVSAEDIKFGNHTATPNEHGASGKIHVQCTKGHGFTLALNEGLQPESMGSEVVRRMIGGTPQTYISYRLFRDSSRQQSWTPGEPFSFVGQGLAGGLDIDVHGTAIVTGNEPQG